MLNNREWALLIWMAIALALLLSRGQLRSSLLQCLRAALHPQIVIPLLVMVAWVGGLVLVASRIGGWKTELATDTAVWFFGTALVLMFNVTKALREEGFFRRTIPGAFKATVFVGVFINLYVFSLPVELILLPVLAVITLSSVVAAQEERLKSVKAVIDVMLALIGFALTAYVVFQIVTDWQDFDRSGALLKFVLPVWLTIGVVPLVYLLGLYGAYDLAFKWIDFATDDRRQRWRAKLALALRLRLRTQDISAFTVYWAKQAALASSFGDAYRAIDEFQASRRERQRAEAERQDELRRYAGVDGEDDEGRRLVV